MMIILLCICLTLKILGDKNQKMEKIYSIVSFADVVPSDTSSFYQCQMPKMSMIPTLVWQPRLQVSPTSLAEIGTSHVKRFHTTHTMYNLGESRTSRVITLWDCGMVQVILDPM
jgi:hypothetical protein